MGKSYITDLRKQVVEEALTWVGTPFVHEQRRKGVGVDCATILSCIYERFTGCAIELPHYEVQWNMHKEADSQPYLLAIMKHCVELSAFPAQNQVPECISWERRFRGFPLDMWHAKPPLPGDIGLWWFCKAWAHTTVVINWPTVLNPMMGQCVTLEHAQTIGSISERAMRMRLMRPRIFI